MGQHLILYLIPPIQFTVTSCIIMCSFAIVTIWLQKVTSGVQSSQVRGIGFDATCSLVVLDKSFQPVPVTQEGECLGDLCSVQLSDISYDDLKEKSLFYTEAKVLS